MIRFVVLTSAFLVSALAPVAIPQPAQAKHVCIPEGPWHCNPITGPIHLVYPNPRLLNPGGPYPAFVGRTPHMVGRFGRL
jgi:hypothetical protein